MRKYIVIALVLVVLGVGASLLLIPGKEEVAHNQAIDAGIAAPNATVAANVDVEAEYNQGHRSFPIIAGLADKRVAEGKRDEAIKLLEEYATANPADAQGHKKLAEQYQLAGRQADYNTQLELVASAEPTEANLRVLSDIYNANKDYPKQAEVLRKIIDVTKGEKPQAFVDLATIQVVIGDQDGAYKTVNELRAKHPDFSSYPMTRILVSSLAQQGKVDEAFKIATDWINAPSAPLANPTAPANAAPATPATPLDAAINDPKPAELADLCNILHYAGHADKAVALVEPHIEMLERSPELVVAYVNANITAGRADHAYAILQRVDEAGKMTAALYVPYLKLALQREDLPSAETIANKLDTMVFSEEQALDIIEVARAGQAPSVLSILTTRFADAKVVENKPVLAAVISILKNAKDQDSKIETALNQQLSPVQRIRLAESCARARKTACFDAIVKLYPPLDKMSPAEIAEYAQLYIIAERPGDLVDPVGAKAQLPNAHADVQSAWHRLAAAAGRHDVLKPWLEQNANTTPEPHLQELFYLANDRHHGAVAGDIAERLYARDPSSINRDILVNGLISAGDYDKALPLLRDKLREPGTNDGQYLSLLSKLARKDASARKELADYAQAALQSDHGDARQQLNYAYILINNGRRDAAIPFAKQYAYERGGEWKKMYAQLTQKPGKGAPAVKLTREQLLAMANSKTISAANKRQVAFQLLNDGYKADATTVFADLARDKGPDSQEVKDLLYLWGGKLNGEQLKWIESRAATASPYDKGRWAELINTRADDQAVLQYVSATPDALYNAALRKRYFSVLARTGSRQNYEVAMRNWVAQTTDVPALTDYSAIALASGYREAARAGYSRVLALDPNNAKALSSMASLDFAKGNYKAAEAPLDQYLATGQGVPDTDPAQAHFMKAQLLKRQGNKAAAAQEFSEVVRLTNSQAPDALSRLYTAQFNLGQTQQAAAGFEALLASHPDDKSILADYMSALIEHKMFDDATRIANQYDKTSPYYGKGASLNGSAANVSAIERFSQGREMKISFAGSIEDRAPVKPNDLAKLAWLEHSELGYDSLTLSAKPGYVVRYVPTADEQFAVVAAPEISPQEETARQQELRLQLLYAQIEQQTGQTERAKQRLAAIKQYYPQDPQLLTAQAGVASAQGNRDDALELLQQAQVQAPGNEDIAATIRSLRQGGGNAASRPQYVRAGYDYRRYGSDADSIYSLSGVASLPGNNETGLTLRNDHVNGLGSERQSAELFVAHYFADGGRLQGSFFTSGDWFDSGFYQDENTFGGGLYYAFDNPLGRSEVLGEYRKPYWDFPNAAALYASRTRGGIKHFVTVNKRLSLGGELSYNSYNVETGDRSPRLTRVGVTSGGDDIEQTVLARLTATYGFLLQTPTQPFLGVGLGVDTEYVTDRKQSNINFLDSRQVNQLTGIYRDDFKTGTHVLFDAGWVYDSENDLNGPVVEGRIGQDITQQVQFDVHGRYGLVSSGSSFNTDDSALEVGAGLQYNF